MNDFLKVTCPTHTCYMSVRITPHGSVARVSNTVSCVCVCERERERERDRQVAPLHLHAVCKAAAEEETTTTASVAIFLVQLPSG